MSKLEINNEIVLMRQCVRRARVHIVRKLVRQVKTLRSKKGDEKLQEKFGRKADKLAQEVLALKKISEDEVSRFSITNEQSLAEILSDPKSDAEKCVLARLSNHKIIADKVAEFKQKYPNYEEHLKPGKRKLMKLRRKAAKQAKKQAKLTTIDNTEGEKMENEDPIESSDDENASVQSRLEINESSIESSEIIASADISQVISKPERQEKSSNPRKRLKTDTVKSVAKLESVDKLSGIGVTSKEATVKRFASFLEENDPTEDLPVIGMEDGKPEGAKIELEREVDSFFVTGDGDEEYLSVVVPKQNIPDEEEPDDFAPSAWRQRNNSSDDGRGRGRGRGQGRGRGRGRGMEASHARNGRFFDKIGNIDETKFDRSNKSKRGNPRDATTWKTNEKSVPESVHPSWAAKKKQQEVLKLGFQGKKIVFDDI